MDKKEIKNKPDKTIPYIKRDFEDDADDKEYKNAAWETWLEKNNAIETDHKNDKKIEWDGKFDNATTRDDVKDDEDDKAISEEESLEELTDGKLEEVEKLKSWESWLEKNEKWDKQEKDNDKKSKINRTGKIGKKDAKDIVRRTYDGQTPNKFMQQVNSNMAADEEKQSGSKHRGDKRIPLTRVRTHTNQPLRLGGVAEDTPIGASHQSDHQLRTGRKEQYIEPKNADLWKTWLEKDALDGKQGIDKLPKSDIKPILEEAEEVIERDTRGKKNDMYKSWLEKQQGAGDARFGNQHLTGLDQEPVDNKEDEANILPAKDVNSKENDEKQEETEDKEGKDNKPYKALSQE